MGHNQSDQPNHTKQIKQVGAELDQPQFKLGLGLTKLNRNKITHLTLLERGLRICAFLKGHVPLKLAETVKTPPLRFRIKTTKTPNVR